MAGHHEVEITSANGANGVRLHVSGDVDMATAGRLLATIVSVAPPPMHEVVVDLEDVSFMDSTGLTALTQAHQQLLDRQVRLVVVNVTPQIATLLDMTRLDGYLNVEGGSQG